MNFQIKRKSNYILENFETTLDLLSIILDSLILLQIFFRFIANCGNVNNYGAMFFYKSMIFVSIYSFKS